MERVEHTRVRAGIYGLVPGSLEKRVGEAIYFEKVRISSDKDFKIVLGFDLYFD